MRINPICNYNFSPKIKPQPLFCGLKEDVFEKRTTSSNTPFGIDTSIVKKAKNMCENELKAEMSWVAGSTEDIAKETYEVAKLTEKMLDEKYGKGKWEFVSIGTSPAGIGKALELRGHKVKYLPISEVRLMREEDFIKYSNKDKHSEYMEYLDFLHLKKDQINNKDMHTVFADYTCVGTTLKYLEKFALLNGIKQNKASFLSLNEELDKYAENKRDLQSKEKIQHYFQYYCMAQQIGHYSSIPHVPYNKTYLIASDTLCEKKGKSASDFEFALCYYHIKDKKSEQN